MQKVYRNTAIFILLILIGVQWGFYSTYTSQFPNFVNKTTTIHVHGALLMMWMVLLIIQPLLIGTGRAKLHRNIGNISWVLGPLIIISMFLVGKGSYWRSVGFIPENENLAIMVLDVRGLFKFAILWALAMWYRKTPATHMRYMIATGIMAIGPGVSRGLQSSFGLTLWDSMTITDMLDLTIIGFLLGYDIYKQKNFKPWLTVFIFFFVGAIVWQARDSATWQSFAKTYVAWFY